MVAGSLEEIQYDLRWLGMQWDEGPEVGGDHGPYFQSERLDIYEKYSRQLIDSGHAYYCYCSPERLEEMRKQQQAEGRPTGYDRHCRYLSEQDKAEAEAGGGPRVTRFAMPESGTTSYHDFIRGELSFENSLQDDFVMIKSDGFPTYNFASVIDDHTMEISHVIRGEEYISSMPKYVHLYAALGWEEPVWVQVPLILGTDRSKLSKRHGAVNFGSYIDEGYLPEALINYLALLGWSAAEDKDLYSVEELIDKFSLEGIVNRPAIFDAQKLLWVNGQYMRMCEIGRLTDLVIPYLSRAGLIPEKPDSVLRGYLLNIVALIQDRLHVLSDAPGQADIFLKDDLDYDEKAARKWLTKPGTSELLNTVAQRLAELSEWNVDAIDEAVRSAGGRHGFEGGAVIHPVRVAATGRTVGPGLFETLELLGRERVVNRLRQTAARNEFTD
jgi:glutamyl-tRNA synthetase